MITRLCSWHYTVMRRLLLCLAFCAAACGDTPSDSLEGDTGTGDTGTGGMCSVEPETLTCGLWGCGEAQLCGGTVEFAVCYDPPCALSEPQVCAFEAMRLGTPGMLVFMGLGGDGDQSVYGMSVRADRTVVRQTLSEFDLQTTLQPAQECSLISADFFGDCASGVNAHDACAFGTWTQDCSEVADACG